MSAPVRAHHIGSLLRPPQLRQAFRERRCGRLEPAAFRRIQDEAIRGVVAMQEEVGLRQVTDGELRRASYWGHFVEAVDGLEVAEALFEFTDEAGDRLAFTAPHVARPLSRKEPIAGEELAFLRRVATAAPKITMPAPSTMHFWRGSAGIDPSAYASPAELFDALTLLYRQEIADLARLGATALQLDEVALAMLCDPEVRAMVANRGDDPLELVGSYAGAIAEAGRGRPPEVALGLHLCRGNYRGHWLAAGGYEEVAESVFGRVNVDVLLLEYDTERAGDLAPLRHVPPGTQVVLGLVSSKTPVLESRDELLAGIEAATRHVPVERLGLSPQCGFASTAAGNPLTEDDQRRKLALVVEVAHEVWGTA